MGQAREIAACRRCRDTKRKCDQVKPNCSRCGQIGVRCMYEDGRSESCSSTCNSSNSTSVTTSTRPTPTDTTPCRVIKKRNRASLSCIRCRRLKVKCNQQRPCGRCAKSGFMDTCEFSHAAKQPLRRDSGSLVLVDEDPEFIVATWFLRRRASGFNRALLNGMEALSSQVETPFTRAVDDTLNGDCGSDFALSGNFPFGSAEALPYASLDKVQELLQGYRLDAPLFIDEYFRLYHPSLPVFEESTFREQLSTYLGNPLQVDPSWLAQYLIVLGLGAYASGRGQTESATLMYASEACLAKTTYMFRPTLANISTLCLMVVAKQVAHATCWVLDACWSLMGVVVHLSMMAVLHQEWMAGYTDAAFVKERMLRRRLWTTVVFLNIQLAFLTGQQCLLPQDTWEPVFEADESATLEDCWDTLLPRAFPVIVAMQIRTNSTTNPITYAEAEHYDVLIRSHMQRILAHPGSTVLHLALNVFFRRVLCNLHTQHAVLPNAASLYPTSYWSSLECSIAQMVHHRELFEGPPNMRLLSRPHMTSFFATAFVTCIQLLASDSPLDAAERGRKTSAKQTIMDTLFACLDIFSKEEIESLCFRTGYRQLKAIMDLFPKT